VSYCRTRSAALANVVIDALCPAALLPAVVVASFAVFVAIVWLAFPLADAVKHGEN